MEKTKKVMLGVQMKNNKKSFPNKRNKKRLLKQVVDYLKADSYLFAPLLVNSNSPSPKAKFTSSSSAGLEIKQPIRGIKKKRLLKKIVDYMKSDSYMYASMFGNRQISSPAKGSVRYVKKVTKEISTRRLTTKNNEPTVQSTNLIAEDQIFEGNLPEASISGPQTSAQKEMVKNMVYSNCRSSSISEKGGLDSRLRKLLVD
ncbi:hypothetical protein Pint_14278 [Pistacia integerrima]|uniref:Uncharacterized protein n=1 Tax=Pistacia integerrima TaxID=434235 RepID=A0ACC0Y6I8_9ROSI|nr:hypothetical protein Pint_14278 [Pistacia integerrima]